MGCGRYGTWFGVEGLVDAGVALEHPSIKRACEFLVSKQKEDGGWGETFESCVTRKYVQHPKSQVVNTAWAVLVLLKAKYVDAPHRPCARAPCMGCLLWNGVGDEAWHVKDRHGQIRDRLLCLGCTRTRAHLPCNMRTLARYHDQGVARRGVELLVSRLTHAGDWASAPVNLVSWQSSVYIRVLPPLHTPSTPPHPHPPPFFH